MAHEGNYSGSDDDQIKQWITEVTGHALPGTLEDELKSGVVLCELANKLTAGTSTTRVF